MRNFVKLITILFALGSINPALAITVFDTPSASQPVVNETKPTNVAKKPAAVKENQKKAPAKKAPEKKTPEKKVPANKATHASSKPQKKVDTAPKLKSVVQDTAPAVAKSALPPLIIVNNFEEDPIFIPSVRGAIYSINSNINIIDVSKNTESKLPISQAYKLLKTSRFWGKNTVFISGSFKDKIEPSIIVAKSKNNQFFITQNSGVLTFIEDTIGLESVREIQRVNFDSKTFNGRDVEYLVGAKLINDPSSFNNMGEPLPLEKLAKFNYTPLSFSNNTASSLFVVEDKDNGDIFTFIPTDTFNKFSPKENDMFKVILSSGANLVADFEAIYKNSLTYSGGNQAIILNYKSSIGSFVILKNVQKSLLSNINNAKISISPLINTQPQDIANTANTDSDLINESSNVHSYDRNNSNMAAPEVNQQNTPAAENSTTKPFVPIQPIPKEAIETQAPKDETSTNNNTASATSNIYPSMNHDEETPAEPANTTSSVRTW